MVVDAVSVLDPSTLDLKMIGIKKVQGGGLRDSFLVDGVAFKKTFSYAGKGVLRRVLGCGRDGALVNRDGAESAEATVHGLDLRRWWAMPRKLQRVSPAR